jgi:hypothetical protein
MEKKRKAYRILVGKPEGKIPLGRARCGWIILKWTLEIWDGVGGKDLIDMAQNRDQ